MSGCTLSGGALGGIVKMKPEITYNNNRSYPNGKKAPDGIEIRFGAVRPTVEVREMLKAHGFQFSEKQTLWYALDKEKSRELAKYLSENEIEADDTQYIKKHFWAKVSSKEFYDKLTNYTEFMLGTEPKRFFRSKKQLQGAVPDFTSYLYNGMLRFKKFYNEAIDEESQETGPEDNDSEEAASEGGEQDNNKPNRPVTKPTANTSINKELAEKLRSLADAMQKQISAKIDSGISRQNPTARRMRIAASMRQEGYKLQATQRLLYALSDAYDTGEIEKFERLKRIGTKSQAELLNRYTDKFGNKEDDKYLQSTFNYNKSNFQQLGISSVFNWSLAISQRDELLHTYNPGAVQQHNQAQQKIQELEIKIKGLKIPGFFPTPKDLVRQLVLMADIREEHRVLEPSAGKGDILDGLKDHLGSSEQLVACEINPTLRELLELKGYTLLQANFLEVKESFDRIVMNPPFENGQDVDHVQHALKLLKPNGRVVAIMSEGVFFRKFKKESEFRELLADKNAFVSDPIKGAFKNAFNQTGVSVRIVVVNKDGTYPDLDLEEDEEFDEDNHMVENETNQESPESSQEEENNDLLELEAEAELELLKMRVEAEKRQQGLSGLPESKADKLNYLRQLAKGLPPFPDVWDFK